MNDFYTFYARILMLVKCLLYIHLYKTHQSQIQLCIIEYLIILNLICKTMKTDFFKRNQRALTMLMFGSAVIVARPLSINAQNVTNTAQRTTVHQAEIGRAHD